MTKLSIWSDFTVPVYVIYLGLLRATCTDTDCQMPTDEQRNQQIQL